MKKAVLISVILFIISCKNDPIIPENNNKYLHISHTRTTSNSNLNSDLKGIDFTKYDMIWLGGDLANSTSEDNNSMILVDSIFGLNNKNTLWSLGNHDYSDLSLIQKFTNRKPYYSYHKNGITFIILDTQDSLSNIVGDQLIFFNQIIDTLHKSSHLILLHHKLIWMYKNSYLEPKISSFSNGELDNCFYCLNPNNFYQDIYPRLVEVKEKGIEVICIGGDIGVKINKFEYITKEDIQFLASGISEDTLQNKALLFNHDINTNQLSWEYKLVTEL